ncbi:MAG: DUF362 domain-containing protein [Bacteroidetes bacterium]|nr:DUF362 domain-containing protein [Bacteroidota bacterium]
MKRRDFIKKTLGAGVAAGATMSIGGFTKLFAGTPYVPGLPFDMVAVKGGEPEVMFDKAIEAMGGMGTFVKKGQKVVVKPNMGWDVSPERAGNTNPMLMKRIVEHCFNAGAKEVYVFDNPCDQWEKCYSNSGIEKAVKDAGGKIVPGNTESYYQNVTIPKGKKLREAKVHELILESDVLINVPVLKHHSSTRLTIAMKNRMGEVWDRGFWHRNDLHQCIADFASYRKPDLNIVDAYRVMLKNGPRGVSVDDISLMKQLLLSPDMVAVDAAAAKIFGSDPYDIGYIRIAEEMKLGTTKLDSLNIKRIIL